MTLNPIRCTWSRVQRPRLEKKLRPATVTQSIDEHGKRQGFQVVIHCHTRLANHDGGELGAGDAAQPERSYPNPAEQRAEGNAAKQWEDRVIFEQLMHQGLHGGYPPDSENKLPSKHSHSAIACSRTGTTQARGGAAAAATSQNLWANRRSRRCRQDCAPCSPPSPSRLTNR